MSVKLQPLRGMHDLLPDDFKIHEHIIKIARDTGKLYGYEGMSTPMLEYTQIFDRSMGENSDVVSKEMYNFLDKAGRNIALRPEFTAGIIRAFISEGLQQQLPLKFFSSGAVFRHDRPQSGRQRQFHQINFEYIGAKGAYSDAETIRLACDILKKLGLEEDVRLELNSIGCTETRNKYQQILIDYFKKYLSDLSEDSVKRLENNNPLRILDSKDKADKEISAKAPTIDQFYTDESHNYFESVKQYLDLLEVKYTINPRMVRGLDYYCHTAFEFITHRLGAQGTILAGGRYDGLAKLMGGADTPAIGFAAGIERLAMMKDFSFEKDNIISIMPIDISCKQYAIKLASNLRIKNIPAVIEMEGKIQKRLQKAVGKGTKYVVFLGSSELENNNYKIKNLLAKEEKIVNFAELVEICKK